MFTNPKLDLNTHKDVSIPKPRMMMERYGSMNTPDNQYSGEESLPLHQSKVEQLLEMDAMYRDQLKNTD